MSYSSRLPRLSLFVCLFVGGALFTASAMAAGFEKSQVWSAKATAVGGAVVGSSTGADALYFNPAGLSESDAAGELSINFSPTFSKFSGATPYRPGSIDGSSGFSPIFGLLASFKPTPKLGIGVGYYVSGGTKSKFENVDYSGVNAAFNDLKPTIETDLAITEAALGAGYELSPGLRFGVAWRVLMVNAKFSTTLYTPGAFLAESTIEDIKATRWNGYKVGLQYEEPNHRWGLGVNFRSSVSFTARGEKSTTRLENAASSYSVADAGAKDLDNAFPYQVALGGWTRASELLRISYEYSYTNYNQNKTLEIRGSTNSTIIQNWKNQHVGRLGAEYTGMGLPIRFGYAYTSQVTPSDRARATFASPGSGHAVTAGTGLILSNSIDLDGALEYSFASGTGRNGTEVAADTDFKSRAYAAHLSAKVHF